MLTAADRKLLYDDIEYQFIIGQGEEKGELELSTIATGRGSIVMDNARTQNLNGGVNTVPVSILRTNANLPAKTRVKLKSEIEMYEIDFCYKEASRLSGIYLYYITKV